MHGKLFTLVLIIRAAVHRKVGAFHQSNIQRQCLHPTLWCLMLAMMMIVAQ